MLYFCKALGRWMAELGTALGGGWSGEVDVETPAMIDAQMAPHLINATVLKPSDQQTCGLHSQNRVSVIRKPSS
ncbi:hypothetical protein GOZ90_26060 [Agrobacterium vitis]|uniref:Uncharacterized protein n=1 Tax=Agrobacterium vitis TaxID=373 RepID=A0A6L6VJY4_AGRVI|nr:hypothetical protein [Agrobacterium vitis]MUZ76110.1 hypothetical protein [Agrobacterium vitis]